MIIHEKNKYQYFSNEGNICQKCMGIQCKYFISCYYIVDGIRYETVSLTMTENCETFDVGIECKKENMMKAKILAEKLK